jgi:hypothetical protein
VQKRQAAGVDLAADGLNAENTGAGVAGKDKSEVGIESGLSRKRLLCDEVEPVVSEAGAEVLFLIAGWELDVQAGREVWIAERPGGFAEIPLDAHVGIAVSLSVLRSGRAIDGEIGNIEIEFKTVRKTVVHFEVGSVLAEIRILGGLEAIVFVIDLEVKGSLICDIGVVGIEGHLRHKRLSRDSEQNK